MGTQRSGGDQMTDQTNNQSTVNFQEAPASWNTRYIDPSGFECQLTLRSASGADLLKKAGAALSALVDAGCTPTVNNQPNGRPHEQPAMTVCEFHNAEMKRHEKDGQVWYSHKLADGSYCKGKK
jgi:hypothetical protein